MMTYESASEAEVLQALWRPGAPLENTVFAILDPTARPILRGGRSPSMMFRDSADLAKTMDEVARNYQSNKNTPETLPLIDSVRLAVDVAACDHRPLVVVLGNNSEDQQRLASTLAPVAWSDALMGKLVYASGSSYDLKQIRGASISRGYLFVAPNLFGTAGSTISQLGPSANRADLEQAARHAIDSYRPQVLNHHDHVRAGHEEGIEWQTAIPITDPHSLQAIERDRMRHAGWSRF
jgi:hypothetical protein